MPQRRVARVAMTAPMNDEKPPTPATSPRMAGLRCSSSSTKRKNVAPKMPHSPASAICAPANARRTGSWMTRRRPSRISARTGSRSSRGGGGASSRRIDPSSTADARKLTASTAIAIGARQGLHQEAADPERHEFRGRPTGRQRRVGLDQPVALDDRRQVGVVGRVEERREDRGQPGHDQQLPEGQDAERERERDRTQERRPPQVRPDEHGPSPQPVHPRARDEPEDERGDEIEAAQDRDLDARRSPGPGWRPGAARSA